MVWQASAHLGGFTTAPRSWLPVPAVHLARAADVQEPRNNSTLAFYRAMLGFRKARQALRTGAIETLDAPEGVLAFTRGREVLCVFNMTEQARDFAHPGRHEPARPRGARLAADAARPPIEPAPVWCLSGGLG